MYWKRKFHQAIQDPSDFIRSCKAPAWVFDQESLSFLDVNDAAVQEYGYSAQDLLSMTILDIRPVEDVPNLLHETLDPAHRGPSTHELWIHRRKDGTTFPVLITSKETTFRGRAAEIVIAVPKNAHWPVALDT